ncbi:Putative fucosyltransferase-like protein [Linum perenne]
MASLLHDGGRGHGVVMTTSLSSDVPVGYFSWAEYDIMAPVEPKTEKAFAAAFISNCGSLNFRLQVLNSLVKRKIPIDSYGACHRNRDGRVNKVKTLKRYKFSLAFENSNEEDYVTEKFFQSLVAGIRKPLSQPFCSSLDYHFNVFFFPQEPSRLSLVLRTSKISHPVQVQYYISRPAKMSKLLQRQSSISPKTIPHITSL